jgi:acetyl esterase/lipase
MRPSWSDTTETLAMILHHYSKRAVHLPLEIQRDILRRASGVDDSLELEHVDVGSLKGAWFAPPQSQPERVILYLHGGGYALGSIDSHRDLVTRLSIAAGARALAVEYRLAPEHRFPAQLDDAVRTYRWLLDQGIAPERIVIGGDSAGGGLTMSTLLRLREEREALPAGAFLISPWVDLEAGGATFDNEPFDYLNRRVLRAYARRFVEPHELRHPLAAPLHAELGGLPPILIHAGGAEVLLDDARRLATRIEAAGGAVELEVWEDMIHAWHVFAAFLEPGREAIERLGHWVRQRQTLAA